MRDPAFVLISSVRNTGAPWHRALSALISVLTLSRYTHCTLGYRQAVLDVTLSGTRYWPLDAYVRWWPSLELIFAVPLRYAINLDAPIFRKGVGRKRPWWPTFWRWLVRGYAPYADDCLCAVLRCLLAGGLDVPWRISSPGQLVEWLKGMGYAYVRRTGRRERFAADALKFIRTVELVTKSVSGSATDG